MDIGDYENHEVYLRFKDGEIIYKEIDLVNNSIHVNSEREYGLDRVYIKRKKRNMDDLVPTWVKQFESKMEGS